MRENKWMLLTGGAILVWHVMVFCKNIYTIFDIRGTILQSKYLSNNNCNRKPKKKDYNL